ncbi:MAG: trypsin-like peptidase domain-containing protein [Candidatus Promineifilaceae bacterium]|nr:trypsin-like peptidase domain-containing protein [Candidatus Promineifilaceae bacterium]
MSNAMEQLSAALAKSVAAAGPAVVQVNGRRRLPASGIVWTDEGVIVTANHVVRRDEKIRVGLSDGKSVQASLAGRDPSTDLAVLRVEATGLAAVGPATETVQVGHLVLALGRPGRTVQATLGIVSALGDAWRTSMGGHVDRYLQTDVVMYPGFSGGPLVDAAGQVVGLNSSALMRGVSLTVPLTTIDGVVDTLLAHGRMRRGYLGVSTQPVRLPGGMREELEQETGLLVVSVEPDSPADQGGLLLGDTIVGLGGSNVRQHDDLLALLSGDLVGQKTPVQIVRGGTVTTVNVTVGERR